MYRTPYSMYEMRLLSDTDVHVYESTGFNPTIKITKKEIRNIPQSISVLQTGRVPGTRPDPGLGAG